MSICSSNHWVVNWSMEKFITRTILRTKVGRVDYSFKWPRHVD
ncbi:hypothetical protein HanXRQr2_Chr03g0132791 [Helianthus annuus]|uniref:Uncharacterized protein n=1 Tax=Helianthus annuus TaxID=4232 RepID=A0A9K3JIW5_HELAN|nr:hypothetical protein HanXRQr2_Chr03g0132791 [Helianthus annuus]KAJ0945565.1 hypothetical protein HanPSC8_Chr03g0129561 [Helianthus annuus]